MDEFNPFRADVPEAIASLNPEAAEHFAEQAATLRLTHDKNQAGDSTFPTALLFELSPRPLYTLGSEGRFYHEIYGIFKAKYVKFDSMDAAQPRGAPLGLLPSTEESLWVATNSFGKSQSAFVLGMCFAERVPVNGEYGWVVFSGVNLTPVEVAEPVKARDQITWTQSGRFSTKYGAPFGVALADSAGDMLSTGELWLDIGGRGYDFTGLLTRLESLEERHIPEEIDIDGVLTQVYTTFEAELARTSASMEGKVSILERKILSISDSGLRAEVQEFMNLTAFFKDQAIGAAEQAGIQADAANAILRSVEAVRTQTGVMVKSATEMANKAEIQNQISGGWAVASAKSAQEASAGADESGNWAMAAEESALEAEASNQESYAQAQLSEISRVQADAARSSAETARDLAATYKGQAEGFKNQAATSATASESSRVASDSAKAAAETARDLAATYRDTALGHRNAASASATASESSRVASDAAKASAEAARDLSATYRNQAEGFKNNAATSATASENSRVAADAAKASAESSATLSARFGSGSGLFPNPNFLDWPTGAAMPTGWNTPVGGASVTKFANPYGSTVPHVLRLDAPAGSTGAGTVTDRIGDGGISPLAPGGWYVMEADVRRVGGYHFNGAGLRLRAYNEAGGATLSIYLNFNGDPDNAGVTGLGSSLNIRSFRKLIQVPPSTPLANLYSAGLHLMAIDSGFTGDGTQNVRFDCYNARVRPATDQEIAAKQASADIVTLQADVTTAAAAAATANSAVASLVTEVRTGLSQNVLANPGPRNGTEFWTNIGGSTLVANNSSGGDIKYFRLASSLTRMWALSERIVIGAGVTLAFHADTALTGTGATEYRLVIICYNATSGGSEIGRIYGPILSAHGRDYSGQKRLDSACIGQTPSGTAGVNAFFEVWGTGSASMNFDFLKAKLERSTYVTPYSEEAAVTESFNAITTLEGKNEAYWKVEAVAGGRAQLKVWADAVSGAGVDIIGDVKIDGSLLVSGTVNGLQLANLAVSTGKLADNAATVPVTAYTDAEITGAAATWVEVQSLAITTTGQIIDILAGGTLKCPESGGTWDLTPRVQFRIKRGSTVIRTQLPGQAARWGTGDTYMAGTVALTDQPGAGTYTYRVEVYTTNMSLAVSQRYLRLLELKK